MKGMDGNKGMDGEKGMDGDKGMDKDKGTKRPWLKAFETAPSQMLSVYGLANYTILPDAEARAANAGVCGSRTATVSE